jgi:hypothetical protein
MFACEENIPAPYTTYTAFDAAGGEATDNCGVNYSSFTYVGQTQNDNVITRTYTILDNCDNPATCTHTITVDDLDVTTYVYLEGSAINPNGVASYTLPMRTSLNSPSLKVLPGQTYSYYGLTVYNNDVGQPYDIAPWNYYGTEGDGFDSEGVPANGSAGYAATVSDWILVSLREAPDAIPTCMKAALLHNDGHVEFVDGGFDCCDLDFSAAYYLVIEHRNHLIVMSDSAVQIVNGTLTFDFRTTPGYFSGQKPISTNLGQRYAMYAGNGDQSQETYSDTEVNVDDNSYWTLQNSITGRYRNGDFNMNGDCNYNDRITFEFNNGIFTFVPR